REKLYREINQAASGLAEIYRIQHRIDSSYHYYQIAVAYKDSMFNEEKSRQIAEMQAKYETEKKEKQIDLLNKDNELKNLKIAQQTKNNWLIVSGAALLLAGAGGFQYFRNRKMRQRSLKQINEAKLASLKSLMDKHFIFSSLNSIDTFLLRHDSES